MQRNTIFLLLACVLAMVWSTVVFGAATPRYRSADLNRAKDHLRLVGAPADDAGAMASERTFGIHESVGASPATSPGYQIGITTYDYQHNGSTGRQIDKFGNIIQATWMWDNQFSTGTRSVYWNKIPVVGSPTPLVLDNGKSIDVLPLGTPGSSGGQPATTAGNRPGYTTFRNLPTGRGIAFAHDAPETGSGAFWFASLDAATAVGVFIQNNAPQPAGINPGDEVIWPHGCTDVVGADTVIHVVARGSSANVDDPFYYWRGVISNTSVTWATPVYMDTLTTISCIVEQDPASNKVAIVYTKPRDVTTQVNNDVVYRQSTDGGLTWSGIINITNYTDSSLDRAYTDVGALYDANGTLHIIYNTFDYRPGDGTYFEPCDLWHWNDVRQTNRVINTVDLPDGGNDCSQLYPFSGGAWNLVMAKPNLIVKPAGVAGIADELLYAVWVQFGPTDTDCATQDSAGTLGGMVNGELWSSVSSNDGLTWDRPIDLTGTKTPDCLPGDCHSEHWVSAARLADSGIYMSYVDDTHAGGVVNNTPQEGAWSTSPYRVLATKARMPVLEPRISVGPQSFLELNVAPNGSASRTVTINNVGNADLTFDVQVTSVGGGNSHVLVNGSGTYSGAIVAAGSPDVLTIDYDGIGLSNPSEHDWTLEVTSNDASNDPGQGGTPITISLNVFVADPWFTCTKDTISTGTHRFAVGSCLELGDQSNGGGLFAYADSTEWIYDATPVIARLNGPTKLAFRDIFWNSIADRSRDSNRAYRAQSAISVSRNTTVNGKSADQASGVATTTDSLIQIDWTATAFKEPELTNGAVAHYLVSNRTGTTFNGIILGAAADVDLDSITSDNDGIADEATQYVGGRGGYYDTSGTIFTPQNNYAALFNIPLDASCADAALGGQVLDNEDYVYPESGYNTDTIYNVLERMPGWNASTLQADTITDVSVAMTVSKNNTLTPAGSLEFAIGLAVSNVSTSDLRSTIAALKNAVNDACIAGCPITLTGDVNLSGTITSADIIATVNFVFKGGAHPQPCDAAADVNCNGAVTSADIIGLVNYVFKGGAPPCDGCSSPLAAGC